MFGWRARIGLVSPTPQLITRERNQVLPDGVDIIYATLDRAAISASEIERIFENYLPQAQRCAELGSQFTIIAGSAVIEYHYDRSVELLKRIQQATGVPTVLTTTANIEALRAVNARKVVIISPLEKIHDEHRAEIFSKQGFQVSGIKSLNLPHTRAFADLPTYAPYRLAVEAVREFPDCDTININCPTWHVMQNIEPIERDTGKTVVAGWASEVFVALRALNIHEPIRGFGKLLGSL